MRVPLQLFLVVLLSTFAGAVTAAEIQTVATWPSAVTTLVVHPNGSATFLCNGTSANACNFVILNEDCVSTANSLSTPLGKCNPQKLVHFQVGLGKVKKIDTTQPNIQYCASTTQPVAIPSCLRNVKEIIVPHGEGMKVTSIH